MHRLGGARRWLWRCGVAARPPPPPGRQMFVASAPAGGECHPRADIDFFPFQWKATGKFFFPFQVEGFLERATIVYCKGNQQSITVGWLLFFCIVNEMSVISFFRRLLLGGWALETSERALFVPRCWSKRVSRKRKRGMVSICSIHAIT